MTTSTQPSEAQNGSAEIDEKILMLTAIADGRRFENADRLQAQLLPWIKKWFQWTSLGVFVPAVLGTAIVLLNHLTPNHEEQGAFCSFLNAAAEKTVAELSMCDGSRTGDVSRMGAEVSPANKESNSTEAEAVNTEAEAISSAPSSAAQYQRADRVDHQPMNIEQARLVLASYHSVRQYNRAKGELLMGEVLRVCGFLIGCALCFIGGLFVVARFSDVQPTTAAWKDGKREASLTTASPGIFAMGIGAAIIIASIYAHTNVSTESEMLDAVLGAETQG